MQHPLFRNALPHLAALVLFLAASLIFCRPALDGDVLDQHDTVGWKGMAQNAFEYKEKNGHFPLWNTNLFSGMPNYQVAMEGKTILPDTVKWLSLGLPKPVNFFFLACVCFYILTLVLGIRPLIGMMTAIAYAFSTYNAVIVAAGHDTQMLATGFLPLVLAGLLSIYHKRYWLGLALTTFGAYQQVSVNHLQISYYFFLIAALLTVGYVIEWVRKREWKHLLFSGGITCFAAAVALAGNALVLKTTSEYATYTMRGGKDVDITADSVRATRTSGLDTSYAFEYSLGKAETFTLIMPNAFGGGSSQTLDETSQVVKKLTARGVDEGTAQQVAGSLPRYWGALPYTSGPAYLGVLIFLLGILGFVIVKTPLRWGLLAATLLGVAMSWGRNFASFNVFLFENLPFYNKFRAPSFAQLIPQICLGIMAALALQQILFSEKARETLQRSYRNLLYVTGGVIGLLALLYLGQSYASPIDSQIISGYTNQSGSDEMGRLIVSGMKADRKALFGGQLLRTVLFAGILLGTLYLYLRNILKPALVVILLLLTSSLELMISSKRYLNDDMYVSPDDYSNKNFAASAIDQQILADKDPHYRVFNMAGTSNGGPFSESRTSYYHRSVGGYHPAKLRTYQDIIEMYLSGRPNTSVLNMLDTRYLIVADPQSGQQNLIPNPEAYGACWLVSHLKIVNDRVSSLKALGQTGNLKDTAILEAAVAQGIPAPQRDSSARIRLVTYDNDRIVYEVTGSGPQYAVCSETYYPKGWNAYIDGNAAAYQNVNYILRGIPVPAGKHTVEFKFEPTSVKQGRSIMYIASVLVLLSFLGGLFMSWRSMRTAEK